MNVFLNHVLQTIIARTLPDLIAVRAFSQGHVEVYIYIHSIYFSMASQFYHVHSDVCTNGKFLNFPKFQITTFWTSCFVLQSLETRIIGRNRYSGRVEVFHNGEWGTICGAGWDSKDVQVACRDAGFPYPAGISASIGFGRIWLSNVDCKGHETRLSDCPHPGWGNVDIRCTHQNDMGIACVPTSKKIMLVI